MATRHVTAPADIERGVQLCGACGTLLVDQESLPRPGFFVPETLVWKGLTFTTAFELIPWSDCQGEEFRV